MHCHYKPYSHKIKRFKHNNKLIGGSNGGKSSLLIVNAQNDYFPDRTLSGLEYDNVINSINELIDSNVFDYYVYTQDIHPSDHTAFASAHGGRLPFEVIDLTQKDNSN